MGTSNWLRVLGIFAIAGCAETPRDEVGAAEDRTVDTVTEMAGAPAASGATLAVSRSDELGAYVTDANGRALYLFTPDTEGTSTCYETCAEAWPPFLAPEGSPTAEGEELDAGLIGATERRDGASQVTYGGHPLYYFQKDQEAGQTSGQDVHGFGGEWYLVTPEGNKLEAE